MHQINHFVNLQKHFGQLFFSLYNNIDDNMCGLQSIAVEKFDARINTLHNFDESNFDLLVNRDLWFEDHNGIRYPGVSYLKFTQLAYK